MKSSTTRIISLFLVTIIIAVTAYAYFNPSKKIFLILLITAVLLFILIALTKRMSFKNEGHDNSKNVGNNATIPPGKIADVKEVFERISDAFVALDANWCYTYMNKKAGEIFDRDPKAMIGRNIWEEFPEDIDKPFYKAYYQAMEEQKYMYMEELPTL